MLVSIVIPAHNEQEYLPGCLDAIRAAASFASVDTEIVVVLNRCTDDSEKIAVAAGALCVVDETRCLGAIRNRGVNASKGEIVITCDADSRLHVSTIARVLDALEKGAVGGGARIVFDRRSLGIRATELIFNVIFACTGLPCGAFWTTREAYDAVGGFDETLPMAEDVDFAKRLRAFGKTLGKPYQLLRGAPLSTSSRKFDHFGDWSFFGMMLFEPLRIRRSLTGKDTEFVDEYFYDFNDRRLNPPQNDDRSAE